jgi:hypothetical protein
MGRCGGAGWGDRTPVLKETAMATVAVADAVVV